MAFERRRDRGTARLFWRASLKTAMGRKAESVSSETWRDWTSKGVPAPGAATSPRERGAQPRDWNRRAQRRDTGSLARRAKLGPTRRGARGNRGPSLAARALDFSHGMWDRREEGNCRNLILARNVSRSSLEAGVVQQAPSEVGRRRGVLARGHRRLPIRGNRH